MFQMNDTSVFGLFPHKSMSMELAVHLYLSRDEFCYRRNPKLIEPLRPCLHTGSDLMVKQHAPQQHQEPQRLGLNEENAKAKKQVSFADHMGQALATVKVFSEFDDPIDVPPNIRELFHSAASLPITEDELVLDFDQPSSDYPRFRQRLDGGRVCLEHCTLKEQTLAGTVKVKNLSFEKSVKVRVTFDTWKSYTDVECRYIRDTHAASDRDTFSFEVRLPALILPHERVEFAVSYEANGETYWDSNQGENYRIVHSKLKTSGGERTGFDRWDVHFDRFGSPMCSHGIFPEWPSYAGYETIGPYY